jgi:hypothetical protein
MNARKRRALSRHCSSSGYRVATSSNDSRDLQFHALIAGAAAFALVTRW